MADTPFRTINQAAALLALGYRYGCLVPLTDPPLHTYWRVVDGFPMTVEERDYSRGLHDRDSGRHYSYTLTTDAPTANGPSIFVTMVVLPLDDFSARLNELERMALTAIQSVGGQRQWPWTEDLSQ